MASYGDGYANHDGSFSIAASSLLNGPKYLINPDLRAKKIISLITLVDVEFCKSFWCLTERYGLQVWFYSQNFYPVSLASRNSNERKVGGNQSHSFPLYIKKHLNPCSTFQL